MPKKSRCLCGRYYVPTDKRINVCEDCHKWWTMAAHQRDVMKFERVRALYNSENRALSYGKFEEMLEFIERRIKNK